MLTFYSSNATATIRAAHFIPPELPRLLTFLVPVTVEAPWLPAHTLVVCPERTEGRNLNSESRTVVPSVSS